MFLNRWGPEIGNWRFSRARQRRVTPGVTSPRVVAGPILLTGIATCATCNGAMTLRQGAQILHLFDLCAAGQDRLQGALRSDGQA
jgi:hypothetical protein